jgi:hypothetical protein
LSGRLVTLVLCRLGAVLGRLPPFAVAEPHWQEVEDVVAGCRATFGLDVVVLRILRADDRDDCAGGAVAYLAEVAPADVQAQGLQLQAWQGPDPLLPHPRRARYAEPGGPAVDLAWASSELAELGRRQTGPARQLRTWNLSSIWVLPTDHGTAWLKSLPGWLDTEPALVRLLSDPGSGSDPGSTRGGTVPRVLAGGDGRLLTEDIAGVDHYGAGPEVMDEAIRSLVSLQRSWAHRIPDLTALGRPDRRLEPTAQAARAVLDRYRQRLGPASTARLDRLLATLPQRYAEAAASGVPDSIVHGDFHPGNVRGVPGELRILDWADAAVGPPVLDVIRLCSGLGPDSAEAMTRLWESAWREHLPGTEPRRAVQAMGPVAELIDAVVYQRFLDRIEPDEQRYHANDPLTCLRAAAAMVG